MTVDLKMYTRCERGHHWVLHESMLADPEHPRKKRYKICRSCRDVAAKGCADRAAKGYVEKPIVKPEKKAEFIHARPDGDALRINQLWPAPK